MEKKTTTTAKHKTTVTKPKTTTGTTTQKKTTTTTAPKVAPKKNSTSLNKPVAKTGTKTTSTKNTKKNEEEQKKQEEEEEQKQQEPVIKFDKVINLKGLLDTFQQTYESGKIPFIIDNFVKNAHVFFKYKGNLINFDEFNLEMTLQKKSEDDVVEFVRKQLVQSMKGGNDMAIYNNKLTNYQEFFGKTQWWDQDTIFTQEKLFKEEYYLEKLLKEEENTDVFGDKGNYMPKKEFKLGFIYTSQDNQDEVKEKMEKDESAYLQNIIKETGLDPKYISFIKIVQ